MGSISLDWSGVWVYVGGMENGAGYWTVTVVVDGSLDTDEDCDTIEEVESIVAQAQADSTADGLPTELYILYHGHANDGDECACVQYLTDHHPDFTWNMKSEEPTDEIEDLGDASFGDEIIEDES